MVEDLLFQVGAPVDPVHEVEGLAGGEAFRHEVNRLDSAAAQIAAVNRFFDRLAANGERLVYSSPALPRSAAAAASGVEEALAA